MTTATADPAEDPKRRTAPAPKAPARRYEDDPAPPPAEGTPAPMDDRLVRVGQRLQLLVEANGEHIGELRAIEGVLRPDGAAYGRVTGLLQALEYDREALGRAIAQLHQAATAIARETAGHPGLETQAG